MEPSTLNRHESIVSWHEAGAALARIWDICEAFNRGDHPEKTEHLSLDDVKAIFGTASAIVEFSLASFTLTSGAVKNKHEKIYKDARGCSRRMAQYLLHTRRSEITAQDKRDLEQWLVREANFPTVLVKFV